MKKFLKLFFLACLGFWISNVLLAYILEWRYRDWKAQGIFFEPIRWEEFYELPDNSLDVLFLGSSHAYRSINPFLVDTTLRLKTFNFGTSGQSMRTSYHVLTNVLKTQTPNTLVVELYFDALTQQDQLTNAGFNFPSVKWSRAKLNFWWDGFSFKDKCIMVFTPAYRYRQEWKYVLRKLMGKVNTLPRGEYVGKGFVFNENTVELNRLTKKNHFNDYRFEETPVVTSNLEYLGRIVKLCRENNIRLIFVTTPIPSITYNKLVNPHDIDQRLTTFARQHHVPYYNFLDARKLELQDTVHFFDNNHLNIEGANIFTKQVIVPVLRRDSL
jgi:hypothetical protein